MSQHIRLSARRTSCPAPRPDEWSETERATHVAWRNQEQDALAACADHTSTTAPCGSESTHATHNVCIPSLVLTTLAVHPTRSHTRTNTTDTHCIATRSRSYGRPACARCAPCCSYEEGRAAGTRWGRAPTRARGGCARCATAARRRQFGRGHETAAVHTWPVAVQRHTGGW